MLVVLTENAEPLTATVMAPVRSEPLMVTDLVCVSPVLALNERLEALAVMTGTAAAAAEPLRLMVTLCALLLAKVRVAEVLPAAVGAYETVTVAPDVALALLMELGETVKQLEPLIVTVTAPSRSVPLTVNVLV